MPKRFTRKKENFSCSWCGEKVIGDGYTNHCPKCLWSKHVDINPGDREGKCKGLMEPVGIEIKSGNHVILHRCHSCGVEKKNRVHKSDSFNAIVAIAEKKGR